MAEDRIQFEVVTPGKLLFSESADMVVVPGGDGDFGVLPGHAPMLSSVRPGIINIYEGDKVVNSVFVEGGIAEVTDTRLTVLAEDAQMVSDLDHATAEKRLAEARAAQSADKDHVDGKDTPDVLIAEAMLAAVGSGR